jgi:hypothetical protein
MEQWIYENHTWYYHYNFTTKKKDAGEISLGACTFFAEVSHKQGQDALEVNCCCKMEDEDNGIAYSCLPLTYKQPSKWLVVQFMFYFKSGGICLSTFVVYAEYVCCPWPFA